MTRRILTALLALIIALVGGAGTLLALNATGHDRASFTKETTETVRAYAAIFEVTLSTYPNNPLSPVRITGITSEVIDEGDGMLIQMNGRSRPAYNVGLRVDGWQPMVTLAEQQPLAGRAYPVIRSLGSSMVAAYPLYQENQLGGPVGALILIRPYAPLNSEIRTLWLILGAISVAAILAATLTAIWLARWVSKPLAGLDAAARRLADGDLTIRAKDNYGPPEVRRLSRTFNTMAGRLETLVHGSRAALADVSHQLRTPLAALRLRLDFLAVDAEEGDPEMAAELAGAQDEVARLSRLVDGLLAVARAENVTPQPRVVDVTAAAEERIVAWHPVAEDRGISLEAAIDHASGPVRGWVGEGHLEQILDNLIANALDALGERPQESEDASNGRVTVSVGQSENGVRITVRDNGPGMGPEDRERAFLRFTSSSPGAGSGIGGTGIGLAIVHRLVTSNGGTAKLTDTPGGGLTVVLDLPAASSANGNASGHPASGHAASGNGSNSTAGASDASSAVRVGTAVGNTNSAR
jgi:signal transduction histidine kinase